MRIEWIGIEWIRIGGIRIGGIRVEWICVGYVWCEIRQQSSEEPCDETSFGEKTDFRSSVLQAAFPDHLLALRTCNTQPHVPQIWFKHHYQHSNDFFPGVGSWMLACGGRGNDQSQRRVVLHRAMTLANHPEKIRAMLLRFAGGRFFGMLGLGNAKLKQQLMSKAAFAIPLNHSTTMPNSSTGHNVH